MAEGASLVLVSCASALEELVWGLGLSAAPLAQVPVLDELALEVAAEPPLGEPKAWEA